jgi:NADH-quinone oxidoreductase subunit M
MVSAIYGAAMALAEVEVRRLYSYLLLSHCGLVLVGLEAMTLAGLGAGLALWLGSTTALVAFGLTLRSVEARFGRLSVAKFQGYYEHLPRLAGLGLVTSLAWIGFPGTMSFVAIELLADSAFHQNRLAGFGVVTAAALSSIAVLRVYFRLFTGHRHRTNISVGSTRPEDWGISLLILLLVGGSVFPQTILVSRLAAAEQLLSSPSHRSTPSDGSDRSHRSDRSDRSDGSDGSDGSDEPETPVSR